MVLETLRKIQDAVERRPREIDTAKNNGQKVLGWIGYTMPEEIIHAMGMIPVRLGRGGDDRLVEIGSRYISTQNCVFVRASAGLFAENKDPYVQKALGREKGRCVFPQRNPDLCLSPEFPEGF